MAADISGVFLNLSEFACIHEIEGKKIACIVDDHLGEAKTHAGSDFTNISGMGIVQADRVVLCETADLVLQPLPGQKILMDGCEWYVADSGVIETEGLLKLPLNRAY